MIIGRSRGRVPLQRTQKVKPPTWGQFKKMTQEAKKIIQQTGQSRNASNLFLAMIAVITVGVSSANGINHSYWAYIPNPLIIIIHWLSATVPIYVDSIWTPDPYDTHGPQRPEEEGMKIEKYTVGVEGIPICIGLENHCLKVQSAAWLSIVKNDTNKTCSIFKHSDSTKKIIQKTQQIIPLICPSAPSQ